MILTLSWLKDHLKTTASINQIIEKLTDIGLEVEGVSGGSGENSLFKIAKSILSNFKSFNVIFPLVKCCGSSFSFGDPLQPINKSIGNHESKTPNKEGIFSSRGAAEIEIPFSESFSIKFGSLGA